MGTTASTAKKKRTTPKRRSRTTRGGGADCDFTDNIVDPENVDTDGIYYDSGTYARDENGKCKYNYKCPDKAKAIRRYTLYNPDASQSFPCNSDACLAKCNVTNRGDCFRGKDFVKRTQQARDYMSPDKTYELDDTLCGPTGVGGARRRVVKKKSTKPASPKKKAVKPKKKV